MFNSEFICFHENRKYWCSYVRMLGGVRSTVCTVSVVVFACMPRIFGVSNILDVKETVLVKLGLLFFNLNVIAVLISASSLIICNYSSRKLWVFIQFVGACARPRVCVLRLFLYCLIGPFASVLNNVYSCRFSMICGGIVSTSGFMLGAFAPTLDWMIVTCGVLVGTTSVLTKTGLVTEFLFVICWQAANKINK